MTDYKDDFNKSMDILDKVPGVEEHMDLGPDYFSIQILEAEDIIPSTKIWL